MNQPLPQFIAQQAGRLKAVGIDQATVEVEMILCHLLDCTRLKLYLDGSEKLNADHFARFEEILTKRLTRYPLQFILGEAWFYGRRFVVTPDVMAPTPETELLCETAISFALDRKIKQPRVLDIGVGSGVISVTVACELEQAAVTALDISEAALGVARKNVDAHEVGERVTLIQSDFLSALNDHQRFDVILSNPPYITEADYKDLPPEVLADPRISLVGGDDGLDAIRTILAEAPKHLTPGGRLMFEIGYGQAEQVARLSEQHDEYQSLVTLQDLNGIDRVMILGTGD